MKRERLAIEYLAHFFNSEKFPWCCWCVLKSDATEISAEYDAEDYILHIPGPEVVIFIVWGAGCCLCKLAYTENLFFDGIFGGLDDFLHCNC